MSFLDIPLDLYQNFLERHDLLKLRRVCKRFRNDIVIVCRDKWCKQEHPLPTEYRCIIDGRCESAYPAYRARLYYKGDEQSLMSKDAYLSGTHKRRFKKDHQEADSKYLQLYKFACENLYKIDIAKLVQQRLLHRYTEEGVKFHHNEMEIIISDRGYLMIKNIETDKWVFKVTFDVVGITFYCSSPTKRHSESSYVDEKKLTMLLSGLSNDVVSIYYYDSPFSPVY